MYTSSQDRHDTPPTRPRAPSGRLGVLLGGLGAISTTLIAGVEAIKRGMAQPVGSLAMLGTIAVGADGEPPQIPIRDSVELASLGDLVFGAWDIVPSDGYAAAKRAGVLEPSLIETLAPELAAVRPWPGIFDTRFNRRPGVSFCKSGRDFVDLANQVKADMIRFQDEHQVDRLVCLWCGSTERYLEPASANETLAEFEAALLKSDHNLIAPSMIYAYAAISLGIPFVNATPSRTVEIPALVELARLHDTPVAGKDLKTGQTLIRRFWLPDSGIGCSA
jgi:myo-inositol-1-phosphate synthase